MNGTPFHRLSHEQCSRLHLLGIHRSSAGGQCVVSGSTGSEPACNWQGVAERLPGWVDTIVQELCLHAPAYAWQSSWKLMQEMVVILVDRAVLVDSVNCQTARRRQSGWAGFELAGLGFDLFELEFELAGLGFELAGLGFELFGLGFELAGLGFELARFDFETVVGVAVTLAEFY